MSQPAPPPAAIPASPGGVARDVACVACGYNLRGLDPAGRCPECGAAVADALANHPFAGVDPAWLRRVARGVAWFNAVQAFFLLLPAGRGFIGRLLPAVWPFVLVAIATAIAAHWLTVPEPGVALSRCRGAARFVLRVASIVWAGVLAVAWYVDSTNIYPGLPRWVMPLLFVLPILCAAIALLVMRDLAARARDRTLVVQLGVVAVAYPLVLLVAFLDEWLGWFGLLPRASYQPAIAIVGGLCVLCLLWTTFLAGRLRQAMWPARGRP
jgi:hypothetical protein